ncbi:MAG: hypothetical protein AAFQ67_02350, partial [Pseudomonadota bacterium]
MTNALIRSASFGALATMTAAAAGAQIKSVEDAVEQSTPIVDFRLRYENADEALFDNAANAITARLRLGFETGELFGTKFLVEFEHIEDFLDDFNSTINGNTEFPIIADPSSTELNRIQLSNTSLPDTKITAGRQVINLDDQRFVGDFDFRQNQQTFDALRVENSSFFGISANAIYLNQANRVFGEDSQFGRFEGDSVLLNAGGEIPFGRLTGFVYLIDIEEA